MDKPLSKFNLFFKEHVKKITNPVTRFFGLPVIYHITG